MGFELPIDVDYRDHPKVVALVAKLGARAEICPLGLWFWAAKFCRDGVVKGGAVQIEKACRWTGKTGALHAAMMEVGLIDPDGMTIHDWGDHGGRKVAAYERKKAAQRRSYQGKSGADSSNILLEENGIIPAESENSSNHPFINETKRNETKEQTKRNETKPPALALAQKAAFAQGRGTDPKSVADWNVLFADLLKSGLTVEAIEAEIDRPERHKSEKPWQFGKRFTGEANGNRQSGGNVGHHRIAVDDAKVEAVRRKTIVLDATAPERHAEESPPADG